LRYSEKTSSILPPWYKVVPLEGIVFINSGGVVSLAPPGGDCIAAQEYKKNIVNMFISCRIMKKKN